MLKEFLVTLGQEDISGKFSETSVHYFSQSYLYNISIYAQLKLASLLGSYE